MKTRKIQFLMPVLAIVFAMTSAFSTSGNKGEAALSVIAGYIDSPSPCMVPVTCSTIIGPICTNGLNGPQAFGKSNPNATICPLTVYRPQ
ncbi:hypothetical protein ESY86_18605 [Subsaximicrobium wynnwilliamsii]|uniref:Uncharacterized protein n=1 Tax=Subsaximicrobium wynnwilliamsii TaxID=291179 RepID=A0A5C6ZD08_9FLAO|nr:DUF6520 family protein [Subsaximicrobium wynnwilliamsii]TXD81185.1 hypothetical protein ESY87_19105 [Subsaximicrobium wynnwilliamsii]TXD87002.1 hypothetical protein ESY86_18605 [Subsaximicrobium wynnwilliamsii]TXE00655.1 hypothetical protein ESY88_18905 [Subsaximicrobium wynnwilliamsii]